jgi:hypothetical protein
VTANTYTHVLTDECELDYAALLASRKGIELPGHLALFDAVRLGISVASLAVGLAFLGTGSAVGSATSATEVVLGSKNLLPNSNYRGLPRMGWGYPHPRRVSNAGVPSGIAFRIHWRTWGGPVAQGRGLTWLYRSQGGYYSKPGAIELRAYGIGRCTRTGPRAYLRLKARTALRPGGPLGPWFVWGGLRNLCRWSPR